LNTFLLCSPKKLKIVITFANYFYMTQEDRLAE